MNITRKFYILESPSVVGAYYIEFGLTKNELEAQKYSSLDDEELKYMKEEGWKVKTVSIGVE